MDRQNLIRELLVKNLKIRYSKSALGFLWAFLSPFLVVLIFYVVFSLILNINIQEAPFILYLMSGVFTWRFFQESLVSSVTSLVDNRNLIKESAFPHYFIPLSLVLANAVDFLPSLFILLISSVVFLKGLPVFVLLLPVVFIIHLVITVASSVIFSILYVKWRDIKYILEVILLLLFYLTPAFYSIYQVKNAFPVFLFKGYLLNPFVCMLSLYRFATIKGFYSLLHSEIGILFAFSVTLIAAFGASLLAAHLYRKNKNSINDYLSY